LCHCSNTTLGNADFPSIFIQGIPKTKQNLASYYTIKLKQKVTSAIVNTVWFSYLPKEVIPVIVVGGHIVKYNHFSLNN
jgi:hypothetical protein